MVHRGASFPQSLIFINVCVFICVCVYGKYQEIVELIQQDLRKAFDFNAFINGGQNEYNRNELVFERMNEKK